MPATEQCVLVDILVIVTRARQIAQPLLMSSTGTLLSSFIASVDPRLDTAWPVLLAPEAMKAAMLFNKHM